MEEKEIIMQLWECLRRGYTYREAQLHMKAYGEGKDTVKKVVVIDDDFNYKEVSKPLRKGRK